MTTISQSIPSWKQTLLERKRKQTEEVVGHQVLESGDSNFSSLPNWKRDLLVKRNNQKNSLVFVGRKKSSDSGTDSALVNGNAVMGTDGHTDDQTGNAVVNGSEEHLLPVKENPWFRRDPVKKKRHSDQIASRSISSDHIGRNPKSWSGDLDYVISAQPETDEVFNEEVTYGKGFVHKLLLKFSHLSEKEQRGRSSSRNPSAKRSHSVENILDGKSSYNRLSGEFSPPRASYTEGISPRSPTRSRSSDSVPSPRDADDDLSNTASHKTSVVDSSCPATLHSKPDDNQDNSVSDNKSNNELLSPSWENISEAEDELPKKNIVAAARNVFELKLSPRIVDKKPSLLSPKPVTSPRNSVHALIAVNGINDKEETNGDYFSDTSKSQPAADVKDVNRPATSLSGGTDRSSDQSNQKTATAVERPSRADKPTVTVNDTKKAGSPAVNGEDDSSRSQASTQQKSYFEKYYQSSAGDATVQSVDSSSDAGSAAVNNRDKTDLKSETETSAALGKKRKAPLPPKPAVSANKPRSPTTPSAYNSNTNAVVTTVNSHTSSSSVSEQKPVNTVDASKANASVAAAKDSVTASQKTSESKTASNGTVASSATNKRPDLKLNLNDVGRKPEVVKGSSGSSRNDAYSVINSSRNRKAKIVTPKSSSGPGNLLIRPASNMIHTKNAQFAKLEFKYDDIRTGEFAPPKKKPSYYDDSDDDDDDDVPVTNIDDVIDGPTTDGGGGRVSRDKNANISKKKKTYEFINAGVVSGKSSLARRRKAVKVSVMRIKPLRFAYARGCS